MIARGLPNSTRRFLPFSLAALVVFVGLLPFGAKVGHAGSVAIGIDGKGAPAVDLVHRGRAIDRDEAIDLSERGVDLSRLDPLPTDAWRPAALPFQEAGTFPTDAAEVRYESALAGAGGLHRSRVIFATEEGERPYQLMISLGAHAALARAALLRQLGYPIPSPRWYRSLKVRFADVAARDAFLDGVSDATLTARKRWLRTELVDGSTEATLQDVVLEPAQIDVPQYHWGIVPAAHLKGRRALRALVIPLTLLDIQESINLFSWENGKILSNSVVLTYPYAENFRETTYADLRWVARRLAKMTREQLWHSIWAGRYPQDVSALLLEKLIARRNHLVQMVELSNEAGAIPYHAKLNYGAVKNGKLTQELYDGYASRFTFGDPKSPLRGGEVARFLGITAVGQGLQSLLSLVNQKLLTVQNPSDVAAVHQRNVIRDFIEHARSNPGQPFAAPVGVWGGPIGGVAINASRNVVTGTYYGSDSKVQLVDSLAVSASLGYFLGFDGIPNVIPSAAGNLTLQRSFLHVRPVVDMATALKTNYVDIAVPGFLKGLAKMLEVRGDAPAEEAETKVKEFLDALKEGEMMIVSDSVVLGAKLDVNVPIPIFMQPGLAMFNPSVGVGGGVQPTVLRRTTFTRTADGVQVYIQAAESMQYEVEFNFKWFVKVVELGMSWKKSQGRTKAFLLDRDTELSTKQRQLAVALKAVLESNDSELLEEHFDEYELRHNLAAKFKKAKFLWWERAGLEETHRVRISPPGAPGNVRTLFSHRRVRTKGVDGYEFFSNIVATLSKERAKLGGTGDSNPANSFLGHASWVSASTEAEVTPGREQNPVTILEHHWGGWLLSRKGLLKTLDHIDEQVRPLALDRPLIRRDEFQTMKSLQMYEILSTLIIYKSGMDRVSKSVFEPALGGYAVGALWDLEGREEMQRWCARPWQKIVRGLFGVNRYSEEENGKKRNYCVKPWMDNILELRKKVRSGKLPEAGEGRVKWTTQVFSDLERRMDLAKLLKWIGKDNFFFQIKVSGFRTHDENGDIEYVSDSVGTFQPKEGAGAFRDFIHEYGIASHELYARYLSEGF